MRRSLQLAALIALLGLPLCALDDEKEWKKNQTIDLAGEVKLATARENCQNWAMAAGLEAMLRQQNVPLDQSFWVTRLNGGELCVDDLPSIDALSRVMNKEFVLEDGRHVQIEIHFVPGAPVNVDTVIANVKQQRLALMLWRGHPYYLTGITYDEHFGTDGKRHYFTLKELRLADTFAKQPGASFQRGRDNLGEIAGMLSVSVEIK